MPPINRLNDRRRRINRCPRLHMKEALPHHIPVNARLYRGTADRVLARRSSPFHRKVFSTPYYLRRMPRKVCTALLFFRMALLMPP